MGNEILPPFQFGTLATDENFIDRVEDRALLKQLISSHINVMLISPRRWGKSSLVKKAMEELQAENDKIKVCYIDAFSISSEAEFYKVFANNFIECASTKAFDLKFVPQERDKMTILQLPETLSKDKGIKIVVCIDEFQQLANLPEYKDMEGKMRSVWRQQQIATYCLYGSKRNMMLNIFNNSNSPFYRFGQVMFLKKISKADWIPFILSSFEHSGKSISEEYANRICDAVECHSWYLQQLCYFVWTYTPKNVTETTYSLGLKQVLNINSPMFQNDTENLSLTQVEMLKAVANGEEHFSSAEARAKYDLGNPNTISKNKKVLQNKDIVEKQGGKFAFVNPIYKLWLKQEYFKGN